MSFSDQSTPSPLRWRLPVFLGRQMTRLVHGTKRSPDGGLLAKRYYLTEEVEWRLGQTYIGLLGFLALPLGGLYIEIFAEHVGYHRGRRHYLGHWAELPLDLKFVIPAIFIGQIVGLISAVRYFNVRNDFLLIDPVSD
ncbi:MAG: hypothetical protein WA793_14975 [Sphingorhabdus sp.]